MSRKPSKLNQKPKLNQPPQAVSGDEAKRRMAQVNADRGTVHQIMTEPGRRFEPRPRRQLPWRLN